MTQQLRIKPQPNNHDSSHYRAASPKKALDLSEDTPPEALVATALREYIQYRQQCKIFELFGTIDYDSDYDIKQQRQIP